MNEDGYGASDREQELNDLEDMSQKIFNLSQTMKEEYPELDRKYGFNAEDILFDLAMVIARKIEELRED
jgi:hypothetical protein